MATREFQFPEKLVEKYRPKRIADFIGLHRTKKVLQAFIANPYDSAWIFLGGSGLGKTTIAMALAEEINAQLHLIPSKQCDLETVDSVTRMCHSMAFNFKTGMACSFHVVLVDEADRMTGAAQDSLLSKLDATAAPPRTIFIFTANNLNSLEGRFQSRCSVLPFESESVEGELEKLLEKIYKKERGTYPVSYSMLAKKANFNVRDAINQLEVELMLGADRADLPKEKDLAIVEEHSHSCPKCKQPWKHAEPLCELPYRSECLACGGVKTVGQHRAKKAWITIRRKEREKVLEELAATKRKKKTVKRTWATEAKALKLARKKVSR